jgi:hypothetical protein
MIKKYTSTKHYLTYYFNGELDRIIERLRKRKNKEFTDNDYCTLNSIQINPARSTNRTGTADLTALRAVTIADIKLDRKRTYEKYLNLKNIIEKQLQKYDQEELLLLKADLGIGCTKAEAIELVSFSYSRGRSKLERILAVLDSKIRGVFDECY